MESYSLNEMMQPFESWLKNDCGRTEETIFKYVSNLNIIFKKLNLTSTSELTPETLNKRWIAEFWERLQNGQSFSTSTRRGYLSALKTFLKFLESDQLIPDGTHKKILLPKQELVMLRGLNAEEKKTLYSYLTYNLKTVANKRDNAIVKFMLATGVRITEVRNIRVHADSCIYTNDARKKSGDFFIEFDDKKRPFVFVNINGKGKNHRQIPVPNKVVANINLYLNERPIKNEVLFQNHSGRGELGKTITRGGAIKAIKAVLENAGIDTDKNVATHVFRHTAIDEWIAAGIPAKHIIAMAGMSSEVSLEFYYKRSKNILFQFAGENNPINKIHDLDSQIKDFEQVLVQRFAS